jgi:hypothetical protein
MGVKELPGNAAMDLKGCLKVHRGVIPPLFHGTYHVY